jgi:glycosyltransferase involved in cell wall biosynthesis
MPTVDILMVTYDSPESTALCLPRLLETCGANARVWLWHNGDDKETLEVVERYRSHPRIARFHHSPENQKLWAPTNWLFGNSDGDYLSKVDDDNLLPDGWIEDLISPHEAFPDFGVLGCWRFADEDFVPELANRKIKEFPGGHRVMLNLWTEGSCFLMKRRCVKEQGLLQQGQSFPQYCKSLAQRGFVNGYRFPFIRVEDLDDPRAPHTLIRSEEEFARMQPLTAVYNGVRTREEWTNQIRRSARAVQSASPDPKHWRGWRQAVRSLKLRARKLIGIKSSW